MGLFELGFWDHELLGRLSWRLFSVVSWENIKVVFVKHSHNPPSLSYNILLLAEFECKVTEAHGADSFDMFSFIIFHFYPSEH
jgi:hypothetical protein